MAEFGRIWQNLVGGVPQRRYITPLFERKPALRLS